MSVRIMAEVWNCQVTAAQRLMLLALADHADDSGARIFPSVAYLSWKTGYSRRQVQNVLSALRKADYLRVVRPPGRSRPTEYVMNLAAIPRKREYAGPDEVSSEMRRDLFEIHDLTCAYCGVRGTRRGLNGRPWTVDRVIPRTAGGRYEWGNVVLACEACNREKGHQGANFAPLLLSDGTQGAQSTTEGAQSTTEKGAIASAPEPSGTTRTKEDEQEEGDLEEEARRLLHEKKKVGAKLVTDGEMGCVRAAVEEFNAQGSFEYGLCAHIDYIVRRVRERPKWDSDTHRRLVQSAFRVRWWEQQQRGDRPRRPSPKVVYGNPGCFEQVVQDAVDERKGQLPPSRRAHQREGAEDDYRRAVEAAMRPDDSAV